MRWLAIVALLGATTASADSSEDWYAKPAAVRGVLDGTSARLVATYRVATWAGDSPTNHEDIALPNGGVVVGATITHGGVAHRMTLDSRDAVEEQYAAAFVESETSARPTTWIAQLAGDYNFGNREVTFTIAAPISTHVQLDIEVVVPTCFSDDARYVPMPPSWVLATRARPLPKVAERCGADMEDRWMSFPAREAAKRRSGDRVVEKTARLAVAHDLHLARTEITLASTLEDVPRDLATVILLDESRSLNDAQRRTQREVMLGYLRAAPNSRVQVVGFARRARMLLPGFMIASRAGARLERELASTLLRNGSNVDRGLTEAGRLLAAIQGTRRVLIVTDGVMASRIASNAERLATLVPTGTVINIAITDGRSGMTDDSGHPLLERIDHAGLVPLAAATTGFTTRIDDLNKEDTAPIDATMLVRPIALDHVRVSGLGWSELDERTRSSLVGLTCEETIEAGSSCVWWARGNKFAGAIQLEGVLWNRRVVHLLRPYEDRTRAIAREIVGTATPFGPADSDDDVIGLRIDRLAHAVSNSTSMIARWGGNVPLLGLWGFGRVGGLTSSSPTISIGRASPPRRISAGMVDLAEQLRPLVAACGLGDAKANVTLELTFDEIADVRVEIPSVSGARAVTLASCVEEAMWEATPRLAFTEPVRTAHVVL